MVADPSKPQQRFRQSLLHSTTASYPRGSPADLRVSDGVAKEEVYLLDIVQRQKSTELKEVKRTRPSPSPSPAPSAQPAGLAGAPNVRTFVDGDVGLHVEGAHMSTGGAFDAAAHRRVGGTVRAFDTAAHRRVVKRPASWGAPSSASLETWMFPMTQPAPRARLSRPSTPLDLKSPSLPSSPPRPESAPAGTISKARRPPLQEPPPAKQGKRRESVDELSPWFTPTCTENFAIQMRRLSVTLPSFFDAATLSPEPSNPRGIACNLQQEPLWRTSAAQEAGEPKVGAEEQGSHQLVDPSPIVSPVQACRGPLYILKAPKTISRSSLHTTCPLQDLRALMPTGSIITCTGKRMGLPRSLLTDEQATRRVTDPDSSPPMLFEVRYMPGVGKIRVRAPLPQTGGGGGGVRFDTDNGGRREVFESEGGGDAHVLAANHRHVIRGRRRASGGGDAHKGEEPPTTAM